MVRKYYVHDGNEITVWIHAEDETFTSIQSNSLYLLSEECIQACEDTVVISITRDNSEKLVKYPQIATFANVLMGKEFAEKDILSKAFNAKGRFKYLQKIAPEIIKRAKLEYIESMIGISQEILSRIRKS